VQTKKKQRARKNEQQKTQVETTEEVTPLPRLLVFLLPVALVDCLLFFLLPVALVDCFSLTLILCTQQVPHGIVLWQGQQR
jgi:hypothetical protein